MALCLEHVTLVLPCMFFMLGSCSLMTLGQALCLLLEFRQTCNYFGHFWSRLVIYSAKWLGGTLHPRSLRTRAQAMPGRCTVLILLSNLGEKIVCAAAGDHLQSHFYGLLAPRLPPRQHQMYAFYVCFGAFCNSQCVLIAMALAPISVAQEPSFCN